MYRGKLQANGKHGCEASLRAASSTDSSLARMPPILLKAGICIPYFSSSFLILLISSSERITENKSQRRPPHRQRQKGETLFLRKVDSFPNNLRAFHAINLEEGIQVGTSEIGQHGD